MANKHRAPRYQSMSSATSTLVGTWTGGITYTYGANAATSSVAFWPARVECVLCETKIPEARQVEHKATCSDECERAQAVATRLAGPEVEPDYSMFSTQIGLATSFASTLTYTWAAMSTSSARITGSNQTLLGKP